MARFIVAPQWQGSSSSRAMQLIDGAEAIAGDLPRGSTTVLDAPTEAGDAQGTRVHPLSALVRMRERIEDAVRGADGPAVVIGGDCGVALGAVAAVAGDDLAVVWIDAHADLNTPDSSPSGAFHGMVLRAIAGEGESPHRLEPGISPSASSSPAPALSRCRGAALHRRARRPGHRSGRPRDPDAPPTRSSRPVPRESTCTSTSTCSTRRR